MSLKTVFLTVTLSSSVGPKLAKLLSHRVTRTESIISRNEREREQSITKERERKI